MIRKIIAVIPCYACYYIGDLASKLLNALPDSKGYESISNIIYPVYNGFMLWSVWWNDFGGLNVWGKPEKVTI